MEANVDKEEFEKNRARGFIPVRKPSVIGKHQDVYPEEKKVENKDKGLKKDFDVEEPAINFVFNESPPERTKHAGDLLKEAADTFTQRYAIYGDNFLSFGSVMKAIFPDNFNIKSNQDWNRLGILVQIVSKLTRYCNNFSNGGHDDSLLDLSVYANMLRQIDKGF